MGGRPICSSVSSLLGIWRATTPKLPLLLEHADAETRQLAERKAEVRAAALAHLLDVVLGGDACASTPRCPPGAEAGPRPGAGCRGDGSPGARPPADVQIGGAFLHHQLQQIGHRIRHKLRIRGPARLAPDCGTSVAHRLIRSIAVARMTSSGVVSPASTLRAPSSRSVRIPISRARARSTVDDTLS